MNNKVAGVAATKPSLCVPHDWPSWDNHTYAVPVKRPNGNRELLTPVLRSCHQVGSTGVAGGVIVPNTIGTAGFHSCGEGSL